mmetsp:Transcript_58865/g.164429  ORF Transcript_58865/g.164429 Transcript_58865/m.164429 type:complete len:317 (+) Transcript_58865:60-1010(+)
MLRRGAQLYCSGAASRSVSTAAVFPRQRRVESHLIGEGHGRSQVRSHSHGHGHGHGHGHAHGVGSGHGGGDAAAPKLRPPGESGVEDALRDDVAAAHRLGAAYGLDGLTKGRISARAPGWQDYLITPGDRLWATVTPWNLARSSDSCPDPLHSAVYDAVPDVACAVVQCSSPAIEAVACLEEGVMFMSQAAAPFRERIGYIQWEGLSDDATLKPDRVATALREVERPPARAIILRNHGALTIGASIGEAFVAMYYLNRACAIQLKALATGQRLNKLADEAPGWPQRSLEVEWRALRAWLGAVEHGDLPLVVRSCQQ